MSLSLRDQLLQAGLVTQKQVKDAEREQQHQQRRQHASKRNHAHAPPPKPPVAAAPIDPAKLARDQALNRKRQEKAEKKALQSQIKQLIDQNRLPAVEGEDFYNFVDGSKIRRIPVNAAIRAGLMNAQIAIVRFAGGYDLVPAAIAARVRERDEHAVVARATVSTAGAAKSGDAVQSASPVDDAYAGFAVPDDLMW